MIRVGVVGLGHMGLLHLRNTRFIEGIQVVGVADKSKKGLSEAKRFGIRNLYDDYKELLMLTWMRSSFRYRISCMRKASLLPQKEDYMFSLKNLWLVLSQSVRILGVLFREMRLDWLLDIIIASLIMFKS